MSAVFLGDNHELTTLLVNTILRVSFNCSTLSHVLEVILTLWNHCLIFGMEFTISELHVWPGTNREPTFEIND